MGHCEAVSFNVVNANYQKGMDIDANSKDTHLYTQIAKKDFSVKVLCTNGFTTTPLNEDLRLTLSLVSFSNPSQKCEDVKVVSNIATFNFRHLDKQKSGIVRFDNISSQNAYRYAGFKLTYKKSENGIYESFCSSDKFAIRAYSFAPSFVSKEKSLIAGRKYKLNINAISSDHTICKSYNTNDVNMTLNTNYPPTCNVSNDSNTTKKVSFLKSHSSVEIKSKNIGKYLLKFVDNSWSKIDQNVPTNAGYVDDCIKDSNESEFNREQKLGCLTSTSKDLNFKPFGFKNYISLQNSSSRFGVGNKFSYMCKKESLHQIAPLLIPTFVAILDDNTTNIYDNPVATAYDENCFSSDATFWLKFTNQKPQDWELEQNATSLVEFATQEELSLQYIDKNSFKAAIKKEKFHGGIATSHIFFGFGKKDTPINPFSVVKGDFNITKIEQNDDKNIAGSGISEDKNPPFIPQSEVVRYFYARVWSPDISGETPLTTSLRYEVYSDRYKQFYKDIFANTNPKTNHWHTNIYHKNLLGGVLDGGLKGAKTTITRDYENNITNGFEYGIFLKAIDVNRDFIHIYPSKWITPSLFHVTFTAPHHWAGEGKLGKVVDDIKSPPHTNRRIEW